MGNFINPQPGHSTFLLLPVIPSLSFLTKWKRSSVLQLHSSYQAHFSSPIFLARGEFTKLAKFSLTDVQIDQIFSKFQRAGFKINYLEFISVLVAYSSLEIEPKVDLALEIFDFDHSGRLSKDEMDIMCRSFLKGIRTVCDYPMDNFLGETRILNSTFKVIDANSDGQITEHE
jgi:Ca2+-binding EF-hand superfamily protein